MSYQIEMTGGGEKYGLVYAPTHGGGARVVAAITIRRNDNAVTLIRKRFVMSCRAANGLGSTLAEHTETVSLPLASFDALACAHATLTAWAAEGSR